MQDIASLRGCVFGIWSGARSKKQSKYSDKNFTFVFCSSVFSDLLEDYLKKIWLNANYLKQNIGLAVKDASGTVTNSS